MKKVNKTIIPFITLFLIFINVGLTFGDVWPTVTVDGTIPTVKIKNNTNNSWILGGVRWQNNGWNWTENNFHTEPSWFQILNNSQGAQNEVNLYYKSNAPTDLNSRINPDSTKKFISKEIPWNASQETFDQAIPINGSEYLLMKTGSQGLADNPESEKPIAISTLEELSKTSDFYDDSYRPSEYDSLGSKGGKYSGGFMDTWLGETQLHFAYPEEDLFISNSTVTLDFDIPFYWMSLGLVQEYLDVDMQAMFAMGAKETFAGTDAFNDGFLVTAGNYTPFHVEDVSGLDRALAYPSLFPEYEERLASARDAGSSGIGASEFMAYYTAANPVGNTVMNSATTINGTIFSSLFQYVNYDIFSHAQTICWKEGLEETSLNGDPYTLLSAMIVTYNQGMYAHIGNVKAQLTNSGGISSLDRNSFGSGNNNYISDYYGLVQKFIDASKESLTDNSISLLDFPITKDMMLDVYFGDDGTVATQGDGGLLRHMHVGNTVMRQLIWDKMDEAFDILKGRAPTVDAEEISYRYDFLSLLRVVKEEVAFNRSFRVAGDAQAHIKNTSALPGEEGCGGIVLDDLYPYLTTTADYDSDTEEFIVMVTGTDDASMKDAEWTLDFNWATWSSAEITSTNSSGNEMEFEIRVPKETVDAYKALGDGESGYKMWIMVTDSAGNSTVAKIPVKGSPLEVAEARDVDGDGFTDSIYIQIGEESLEGGDVLASPELFNYSWPDQSSMEEVSSFDYTSFYFTPSNNSGEGLGKVEIKYPSMDSEVSKDILDKVGPALAVGAASLDIENEDRDKDELYFKVTEGLDLSVISSGKFFLFAETENDTSGAGVVVESESESIVSVEDGKYRATFGKDDLGSKYNFVRFKEGGVSDTARIPNYAQSNSNWIKINVIGPETSFKTAGIYDVDGNGTGDSLFSSLKLGTLAGILTAEDIVDVSLSWGGGAILDKTVDKDDLLNLTDESYSILYDIKTGFGEGEISIKIGDEELSGVIDDRVGPALTSEAKYSKESDLRDFDTLLLIVTEELKSSVNGKGKSYLEFSTEQNTGFEVVECDSFEYKSTDEIVALLPKGIIEASSYNWVRLSDENGVVDLKDNLPHRASRAVPVSSGKFSYMVLESAHYIDEGEIANGLIDKLVLKFDVDLERFDCADKIKNGLILNEDRDLIIEGVEIDGKVAKILISDDSEFANTAITEGDTISIPVSFELASNDTIFQFSVPDIFEMDDNIAPVLIETAYYDPIEISDDDENVVIKDDLTLKFSEEVDFINSNYPFEFYDLSENDDGITLEIVVGEKDDEDKENSSTVTYEVIAENAYLPEAGDSIRVVASQLVKDLAGNEQNRNTEFVELTVGIYTYKWNVFVYPNPYSMQKVQEYGDKLELMGINSGDISEHKVAIIVTPKGPRRVVGKIEATVAVLDNVGNVMTKVGSDDFFDVPKIGGKACFIPLENKNGKNLASGSYLGVMRLNITSNGLSSPEQKYGRIIGVQK